MKQNMKGMGVLIMTLVVMSAFPLVAAAQNVGVFDEGCRVLEQEVTLNIVKTFVVNPYHSVDTSSSNQNVNLSCHGDLTDSLSSGTPDHALVCLVPDHSTDGQHRMAIGIAETQ